MDVSAYLNRINYTASVGTDKQTLFGLQKAHLLSVPFENLDIHYKVPITLETASFFNKIVLQNRGGFCYELNGLFYELLHAIGFDVHRVSARVHDKNGVYSPEYDHMALLVTLDGMKYLVDVGFGKFILEPLTIYLNVLQNDPYGTFVLDPYETDLAYIKVSELSNGNRVPQYIFNPKPRSLDEFEGMCNYHQTSPDSHFTRKKVISLSNKKGRITLNNNSLKITEGSKTKEVQFNENQFEEYLKKYFAIDLNSAS
ncbi:arylamine N-acetyltransferase family protein [Flagellimonas flava]|uniref:arylamine N-acetyltransferase family protein n=1 Tax=Flagellimonas flava TaxID=570519 RepID=UPI003D64987D